MPWRVPEAAGSAPNALLLPDASYRQQCSCHLIPTCCHHAEAEVAAAAAAAAQEDTRSRRCLSISLTSCHACRAYLYIRHLSSIVFDLLPSPTPIIVCVLTCSVTHLHAKHASCPKRKDQLCCLSSRPAAAKGHGPWFVHLRAQVSQYPAWLFLKTEELGSEQEKADFQALAFETGKFVQEAHLLTPVKS
eukprot:1161773-Pelagomonas_calceolata.AAC.7